MSIGTDVKAGNSAGQYGTFTQTGGTVTIGNDLKLGGTGQGQFTLAGGDAFVGRYLSLGGNGAFTLASGRLHLTSDTALQATGGAFSYSTPASCSSRETPSSPILS